MLTVIWFSSLGSQGLAPIVPVFLVPSLWLSWLTHDAMETLLFTLNKNAYNKKRHSKTFLRVSSLNTRSIKTFMLTRTMLPAGC